MASLRNAFSGLDFALSTKRRLIFCALAAFSLSGCATSGALKFKCDGFDRFVRAVPPSQIVKEIQADAGGTIELVPKSAAAEAMAGTATSDQGSPDPSSLFEALKSLSSTRSRGPGFVEGSPPAALLLSGGGQWGAFGAGFLKTLHDQGRLPPNVGVITGISTGGMQSLFVGVDQVWTEAYPAMIGNYSPDKEGDVVNRYPLQLLAGITGSMAGLKPLRRKVEAALCTRKDGQFRCALIDRLAGSGRSVFIGFVRAEDGTLVQADAVGLANLGAGTASEAQRRNAQQCLTAVALASAAMPVFFQQVRINDKTYYDGGVRQSVFEANVAETLDRAVVAARAEARRLGQAEPLTPILYVLRNGPTQLLGPQGTPDSPDHDINRHANALDAALRAEAIAVNQLEVGSIAALRITHPTGPLKLVTADGYNHFPWHDSKGAAITGCPKRPKYMFDPPFMLCLQSFGRSKAERADPWITISPLDLSPVPPPAGGTAPAGGSGR